MSEKKSSGKGRTRNFATVVYPESAPMGWQNILGELCVPAFISPLHNKDVNPDGLLKKEHYHVMLMFDGVKTTDQVLDIFNKIGGVGQEIVQSARGYARYLCHMDNPEKYQYSQEDVKCYGGADYPSVIGLATDKYKALAEMEDFCETYHVIAYATLSKYARLHRMDWYRILCDCGSVHMREYVKSLMWARDNNNGDIIDIDTGEVILKL